MILKRLIESEQVTCLMMMTNQMKMMQTNMHYLMGMVWQVYQIIHIIHESAFDLCA